MLKYKSEQDYNMRMNLHEVTVDQLASLLPASIIDSFNTCELEKLLEFWKWFYRKDRYAEFDIKLFEGWIKASNYAEAYKTFYGQERFEQLANIIIDFLNSHRGNKIVVDYNNLDKEVIEYFERLIGHHYYNVEIWHEDFKEASIYSNLFKIK